MSGRHRGRRRRPFAAARRIWPKHCACSRIHHGYTSGLSIMLLHTVKTVLPRGGGKRYADWYDPQFITMTGTVNPE